MERCSCCNARLRGATVCRRCGSDLSKALAAEQAAQLWLRRAIDHWLKNDAAQSLKAAERSLSLKYSATAAVLRNQALDRLCRDVLELLALQRISAAKRRLYPIRQLISHNTALRHLDEFTDFLFMKQR